MGWYVYRLIGSAALAQFVKCEPLWAHVNDSFIAPAAEVPGKPSK